MMAIAGICLAICNAANFFWAVRRGKMLSVARKADPLVAAIETFRREKGRIPNSLDEIVPAYIPAVPEPGLRDCSPYEYVPGPIAGGDSPYEIRVECPLFLSFDVFFYWPSQHYPTRIYSGYTEQVAEWCYVFE